MSSETTRHSCKCGCGTLIARRKTFADKLHQLKWMRDGGASEMNALQPIEAKELGGHVSGSKAVANGRLAEASIKGAAKSREIGETFRRDEASAKLRDAT